MITKKLAQIVLNECLSTGADFAEIFLEETEREGISLDNSIVETVSSSLDYGAGIRLICGLRSVYGYTNNISRKGLLSLASSLKCSFDQERTHECKPIAKVRISQKHNAKISYQAISKEEKIAFLKKCEAAMHIDEKIVRTVVSLNNTKQNVQIFNSDGKEVVDTRVRGRMALMAVAKDEKGIETSFEGPGAQKGMEFFFDENDMIAKAKEVAKTALIMLKAKECPSGKMPVVIGNGFGGVIFHEACGHSLEATSVSKNLSVFSNKLGEKIASDVVSAVDDGTIEGGWGSGNVDDEGNKCQRNVLIKNGILTSYMVDSFNGRRMNAEQTGSSRRESYRYEPTSRMTNTFILPGKSTVEEMIASVKYGLYAKSLGGGSVNPATGEFNFACTEAYMIENGKVTYPVKGATLIGSGKDILLKIDMVGNDLKRAQGMCGSASGSIPVDVGQPTIRVSEITVGGSGGNK